MPSTFFNANPSHALEAIYANMPQTVSVTTTALSSAYSYGSSGAAAGCCFVTIEGGTLTDFKFQVASYTGSWAATDGVVNVEVREGLNGNFKCGTTLVASFTVTLDGVTTGWVSKSGLSITLDKNKIYTISIGDADGGATNFVTLTSARGSAFPGVFYTTAMVTTNGWSTGASGTNAPTMAFKIDDRMYGGGMYGSIATVASGTYQRGSVFTPAKDALLVGAFVTTDTTISFNGGSFKLYASGVGPSGTPIRTWTPPAATLGGATTVPALIIFAEAEQEALTHGTTYRFVYAPAASITTPRKNTLVTGADADILSLLPMSGTSRWTEESGGAWVDDTNAVCQMAPIIAPTISAASGGGVSRSRLINAGGI